VRNYHVNTQGWSDIAYSFGVCPHGIRFEGRGWWRNQWANGADVVGSYDGRDSEWYTVLVFLGEGEQPTVEMVDAARAVIQEGRDRGLCGTQVLPHNAFKRKTCPGPEFTAFAWQWNNAPLYQQPEPPPPSSVPPPVDFGRVEDMAIHTKLVPVGPLGPNGEGWADPIFEQPFTRIVSAVPNGPFPPVDGYWPLPAVVAAQARGDRVIVTVQGGWPGSTVNVWVSVA
jgi:hypothetical protein